MDADPGQQWGLLVLALVLIGLSFCFAIYEQSLRNTTPQVLEKASGSLSARRQKKVAGLVKSLSNEHQTAHVARLTTCLLGLIFLVAAVFLAVDEDLISVLVSGLLLGILACVLGEALFVKWPLKLAVHDPVQVAFKGYRFGHWFLVLFMPLVIISSWFNKLLGKDEPTLTTPRQGMSWQNIVDLIEEGRSNGEIDNDEYEMIEGILSLHEKMAREVMVPRIDAFMIDITNDNDRSIDDILQMNYSRVPVYHEDKDNIIGVVHIKNLVKTARRFGFEHTMIRQVMREPFFVPETIMIDQLIYEMKNEQNQMAILLDEYGGVVGVVTLEDLIEEIVGEIEDESDEPDQMMVSLTPADFIVQGKMTLDDFNEEFGQYIQAPDVDTIAGYVITQLGYIPQESDVDTVTLDDGSNIVVHKMEDDRLLELEVELSHAAVDYRVEREKSKKKAQAKLEMNR